jgi:hypothetical protein
MPSAAPIAIIVVGAFYRFVVSGRQAFRIGFRFLVFT